MRHMRTRAVAIFVLVFAARFLTAQDTGVDEAKMKTQFEGKIVSLHHFYVEKFQRFDADGAAKEDYPTCSWTMCGKVNVDKVSISKNKIKIEGRRTWVLFKGEPRQITYANSPELVEISIDLADGPEQSKRLNSAFSKIFLVGQQKFEDDVPDFWKPVFRTNPGPSPFPPPAAATPTPSDKPRVPQRVRISQGVNAGLLIHKVTPTYPETAKWTHISGSVVMAALIDKQGNIANLALIKPAGAGLDEAAYEGVKQWKYKPYFLQGQPVEIYTQITVNFELRQ
jgi:TonB family protein